VSVVADLALRLDETEKLDAGGSQSRLCIGNEHPLATGKS
jgi:hypothetical protein